MKITEKVLSLGLASVLLATTLLTGCGKDDKQAASNEPITLKMLVPGYDGGYLKKELDNGIKGFEEKNPNIKVQIQSVGWDELNSKIIQLFQSKDAPDIMMTGSRSLKQLADIGAAEDLTPFMSKEFIEKRVKNVLDTANIDGKQYGIPMAFSSRALYYRTDLVKTPPKNWNELLATAQEVHKANPKVYGFSVPTDIQSGTDELLNFIYQNNGKIVDKEGKFVLNSKENIETLEYLKKFNKDGVIPDPVSTARGDQATLFKNGNLAMFISGPWEKDELEKAKDKYPYAVAPLPMGVRNAETLVTDSYVISTLSSQQNKEAAWKFIEFMGQPEYQRPVSEAFGWFPILKDEENDARFSDELMKPFAQLIKDGVSEPHVPNWDKFNKDFLTAVQKTMTGQESAKNALDQAQAELSK